MHTLRRFNECEEVYFERSLSCPTTLPYASFVMLFQLKDSSVVNDRKRREVNFILSIDSFRQALYTDLSFHPSMYNLICLSIHQSINRSVDQKSIYLSNTLSIDLSIMNKRPFHAYFDPMDSSHHSLGHRLISRKMSEVITGAKFYLNLIHRLS